MEAWIEADVVGVMTVDTTSFVDVIVANALVGNEVNNGVVVTGVDVSADTDAVEGVACLTLDGWDKSVVLACPVGK